MQAAGSQILGDAESDLRGAAGGLAASVAEGPPLPLTDRERELAAIIGAYNDVTERLKTAHERLGEEVARLREELRQKSVELRRRERLAALGEMAAGLAHEVRNPLGGIALYSSMLEGQLADRPASRMAAAKISQSVRSLDQLVSEILDFAQEHHLELQECRLGVVLAAAEDGVRPWAAEHRVTVTVEPSAMDVEVCCDARRLQRAVLNLLMNGVQAVGQGGHVWVSAVAREDRRGVEIEVSDDGPGIPMRNLERIFNPFFTTRTTGTGLGLAIVHRIVESHGGSVRVSNRPEGGARFVIRLPAEGS